MADTTYQSSMWSPATRTVTGWTIALLVLLRISIGWHFLYEGVWKLEQEDWRATPYLVASSGPFQWLFRDKMVKDVDGLERLTPESLWKRMDQRFELACRHYNLSEEQKKELKTFVERKKHGIQDDNNVAALFAQKDFLDLLAEQRRVAAAGDQPDVQRIVARIQPIVKDLDDTVASVATEEQLKQVKDRSLPAAVIVPASRPAVDDLNWATQDKINEMLERRYEQLRNFYNLSFEQHQSRWGWRYRRQKQIGGARDMNNVAAIFANREFQKQLNIYKDFLAEIHAMEREAGSDFKDERLAYDYKKKFAALNKLLEQAEAPLRDIDPKVMDERFGRPGEPMEKIFWGPTALQVKQLMSGPLPKEPSQTMMIDWSNMIGLTAIGACLVLGLFTRLAAICGAGMLTMFYLAMPPWPGYPEVPMQEGHYMIVNKNLIEMIALLAIASSGVGRWWGLDAYLSARSMRRKAAELDAAQAASTALQA